jgi:hypothetical protein
MHNPSDRAAERTALIRCLDRNHQIHHGRPGINFNVVFPLADLVFWTLQRSMQEPYGERSTTSPT